ncbi:hypothetical protein ABW21_db0207814 [Orbilia brochopaga]|nr:hypothetical protein ABW21_db0207814 [Drechslerella brochopaga]
MEPNDENAKLIAGVMNKAWTCNEEYLPGTYELKLRDFTGPSSRSAHTRTYNVRAGTTLGDIISRVLGQRMHHFAFLSYTYRTSWKGCGDHALHCWATLVQACLINSLDSIEEPTVSLADEMTITYLKGGTHAAELVGRWFENNPVKDE